MAQLGQHQNAQLDEQILRGMILNSIRSWRQKFGKEYGEMVICCDSSHSWRKDIFPYYKAHRAKLRAQSEIDWKLVFRVFEQLREELKEFFPYRVIHVDGAEADDIIGVLAREFGTAPGEVAFGNTFERIVILSGDKDFKQLHRHDNVQQYSPVLKKYITCSEPDKFLNELIIRGDKDDGVPNFLSADDILVREGTRQKSIMEVKLHEWLKIGTAEGICAGDETLLRNWRRNEQLVDLTFTPDHIRAETMAQYEAQAGKNKSQLENYFIKHRLRHLHAAINEF